jgi:hypothetical protein
MAWINGRECEAFCYALDMDYRALRERGAALYRRFLEAADGREKASGRPRTRRKAIAAPPHNRTPCARLFVL